MIDLKTVESALLSSIRGCLLTSIDVAGDFAHSRPEYAEAVTHFSQEIERIKKELLISFEDDSAPSLLDEIVEQLRIARSVVTTLVEHRLKSLAISLAPWKV